MDCSQLVRKHYAGRPRHYMVGYAVDEGVKQSWYQPEACSKDEAFNDALGRIQTLLDRINHGKHRANLVTREQITLYIDGEPMQVKPVEAQTKRKERFAVERWTKRGWKVEGYFRRESKARDYILNDPASEGMRIIDRKK